MHHALPMTHDVTLLDVGNASKTALIKVSKPCHKQTRFQHYDDLCRAGSGRENIFITIKFFFLSLCWYLCTYKCPSYSFSNKPQQNSWFTVKVFRIVSQKCRYLLKTCVCVFIPSPVRVGTHLLRFLGPQLGLLFLKTRHRSRVDQHLFGHWNN